MNKMNNIRRKSNAFNMNITWSNDDELFALIEKELFSAVVGDIMDTLGYLHQFLPAQVKPLAGNMFVAGRSMTVLEEDIFEGIDNSLFHAAMAKPFGFMLEALDDLKKNEVYICTGASPTYALWGELMTTRAMHLGAKGAVVNGYSRDTKGICQLNFPTFSHGAYAQDQAPRGKVVDFRVPIEMGGVKINPGDIVIGDIDGVCIVPREIEEEVFTKAIEKARGEKTVQKAILNGMSAGEAFKTYGIL